MDKFGKSFLVVIAVLALLGPSAIRTVSADEDNNDEHPISDFALLDQEPTVGDVSVQCGATRGDDDAERQAYTMHITMTNRGDLGGVDGFVRVTYHDLDFVDYALPKNRSIQISLAGGGTPGVDDAIKVTSKGGAVLIGQASLLTDGDAEPLAILGGTSFCTTTPTGSSSPF